MNTILQLLSQNKGIGHFSVENKSATEATIFLHDVLVSNNDFGGISAIDFCNELNNLSAQTINLHINSPGGDVFAARAMVEAMRQHPSAIHAYVDGLCASAATYLVTNADRSFIAPGGSLMIHRAHTLTSGDAKELIKTAQLLDQVDNSIIGDYVRKTGKPAEEIGRLMDNTTYFFGQEAVNAGFVDALSEAAPKNTLAWNLAAYEKVPEQPTFKVDLSMHLKRLQLLKACAA